jgi:hypothetical protein
MDLNAILAPLLAGGITKAILYIGSVGGVAVVLPKLLEMLKGRVPFLEQNREIILRVVAVSATLATSLGIGYSYDLGTGKLVVDGMTPLNLAYFVLGVAAQFGLTEWVYQRFIKGRK